MTLLNIPQLGSEELVNCTSVMDPTNTGDIKLMAPLGIGATNCIMMFVLVPR